MEQVVSVLTQINEKAEKILSDANAIKLNMQNQLMADLKDYEENLNAKTEQKIKDITNEINQKVETKKTCLYEEANSQIKAMEDNYNQNHDTLVEDLFNKTIAFEG